MTSLMARCRSRPSSNGVASAFAGHCGTDAHQMNRPALRYLVTRPRPTLPCHACATADTCAAGRRCGWSAGCFPWAPHSPTRASHPMPSAESATRACGRRSIRNRRMTRWRDMARIGMPHGTPRDTTRRRTPVVPGTRTTARNSASSPASRCLWPSRRSMISRALLRHCLPPCRTRLLRRRAWRRPGSAMLATCRPHRYGSRTCA